MNKAVELEKRLVDLFYNKMLSMNLSLADAFDDYVKDGKAKMAKAEVTTDQIKQLKYLLQNLRCLITVYKQALNESENISEPDKQKKEEEIENASIWAEDFVLFAERNCNKDISDSYHRIKYTLLKNDTYMLEKYYDYAC